MSIKPLPNYGRYLAVLRAMTPEQRLHKAFERRQRIDIDGQAIAVSAPEDTILMKLKSGRDAGGSERQASDARQVFEVQRGALDIAYLER